MAIAKTSPVSPAVLPWAVEQDGRYREGLRCATVCVMEQVGVREIRQNISVFLRRVKAGEAFTVTEHGSPVALLAPVPADSGDGLADLVATGQVLPAPNRGGVLPTPASAPVDRASVTQALLDERRADER